MLWFELGTFGFAWWLGLFLASKGQDSAALRWTAAGLISYALSLSLNSLGQYAEGNLSTLLQLQVPLLLAPLVCWVGALWSIRQDLGHYLQHFLKRDNRHAADEGSLRSKLQARGIGLILIASVAFGLGIGLIFLPLEILPRNITILAISADLFVLGYAIGFLDAFHQGEAFLPEFIRAFVEAELVAALLGAQIIFVMVRVTGSTFPMILLLYFVIGTAIILQVFSAQIQFGLDQLIFRRSPQLREDRATLREMTAALPRTQPQAEPWNEEEFFKLTRKALSHISNMPKLATSPLIYMPLVNQEIEAGERGTNPLDRAAALKGILVQAIDQLKPDAEEPFGTGKGWRHYNALYFPYVRGLKPYSRRLTIDGLNETEQQALDWFIREVPTRTLFNWQTAGAKVVAKDLYAQNSTLLHEEMR